MDNELVKNTIKELYELSGFFKDRNYGVMVSAAHTLEQLQQEIVRLKDENVALKNWLENKRTIIRKLKSKLAKGR